jgi:predicted  nucleic acid-binding Zn-ribbon protein
MAHPFGDQDQTPGGGAKRPAQTIEGTATEVKNESAPGETASAAAQAETANSESLAAGEPAASHAAEMPPPPPPRPGRVKSFFTHCVAGLLGGLVGVAALALAWSHIDLGPGTTPAPDMAALEQRLAKLEAAPHPSVDPQTLSQLESKVDSVEAGVKELSPKLAAVSDRVAKLETSLKTLAETASDGGSVATAAAIAQQIAEAEQRLDAKIAAAIAEGKGTTGSALEQMQTEIAGLKAKLGALAEAELGTGASADLEPELAALTERIAKLEAALAEIVTAVAKESAGAKAATVAIAFANLRAAVSDGRPYAAELDTIGSLAPSVGDLGVLPAYAESGIPTVPELIRSFATARDTALAAPAPAAGASLVDNLMASVQSLVKIRRVDEAPAGDGPAATLARAQAALDQGDLAAAVKEVETLDAATRETFSAWLGQAHAHLGADETLTRLEGVLLASMGGDAQTAP